ncbi:MAG: hypothetical protein K2M13_01715 [Muribaculaceae bacterium]|nr:hypothetical protein [Muribaculaceae bacterium]
MIHIFNPDTELTFEKDTLNFTPGKSIVNFIYSLSLLPALYGEEGDRIILPDYDGRSPDPTSLPFYALCNLKGMEVIPINSIAAATMTPSGDNHKISPWGWNKALLHKLTRLGVPEHMLPDKKMVEKIRMLAHRSLTMKFFQQYDEYFPHCSFPLILTSASELELIISNEKNVCLKAPWSSSGRGVVFSNSMEPERIMRWGEAIIRNQGGLMAEKVYPREKDFASEWRIKDGKAEFAGMSLFKTSEKGKYSGNLLLPQNLIFEKLRKSTRWSDDILTVQREFLDRNISPYYSGPVGIDMLSFSNGEINPCVEINIRRTMGHVALKVADSIYNPTNEKVRDELLRLFPNYVFTIEPYSTFN